VKETPMNRNEFEQLRNLPGKRITGDIVFTAPRDGKPNLVFDQVVVANDLQWDVLLNGTYKPGIPAVSFNFVIRGLGPVCRIEVNGPIHGDAGRTHKHDLRSADDPRLNLPNAVARTDLEGRSAREVWEMLYQQANIIHEGTFHDPEGGAV
jgi:hypothetical protein